MARAQPVSWRTGSPRQCDLRKQTPSDRGPLDSCRIEATRSGGLAMNRPILLDLLLGWLGFEDEDDEHEDEDEALHGPNACAKRKGPCHESPIPFGIPLRMKKY